ncbi:MAG: regulator of amino acid metabolism, contains ACT domain protein [Methanoregulaceae archaeon]
MWAEIIREFSDSPSQGKVVRFLLENGFGINESGRVTVNGIEIPATQIAKAIHVDRRVVDATARRIMDLSEFRGIFLNMRTTPDLSRVAESLGFSVITVLPKDANEKGIVVAAVEVLASFDLPIRQIFVTDPHTSEAPKLVIIVDEALPAGVIEQIRALPQVRQVIL